MWRFAGTCVRCFATGWLLQTLFVNPCAGEHPFQPSYTDPLLESWRWRTFPELSGLDTQSVGESSDGALWFGTGEGVRTYDGRVWRNFPAAEFGKGAVVSIGRRAQGGIFLATLQNLVEYDDRTGGWTRLLTPRVAAAVGEFRKMAVAPNGDLWSVTSVGVVHWRPGQTSLYTAARPVGADSQADRAELQVRPLPGLAAGESADFVDVVQGPTNRLWLATSDGRVFLHEPDFTVPTAKSTNGIPAGLGRWTIFREQDGLHVGGRATLLPLADGNLWVIQAGRGGYLDIFDGTQWRGTPLAPLGLRADCGFPIQTRDGTIWFSGRYTVHAFRGGRWRTYQRPEAPIPSAQNLLIQSSDGALWIVGPTTEVRRLDYQTSAWLGLSGLNLHWESPAGVQWFLSREGRVVRNDHDQWTSFGAEDGVIDAPVTLLGTRGGAVWVAGSHGGTAATAQFEGGRWKRHIHSNFSWSIDVRAAMEASDGSVWFGAAVDSAGPKEHRAGLLQFRDGKWIHHHQPGRAFPGEAGDDPARLLPMTVRPEPVGKFLSIGESNDGRVWVGRNLLAYHDGSRWIRHVSPPNQPLGVIETILTSRAGHLWVGTRQFGALRYDGREWHAYRGRTNLVANSVRSFAEMTDGSIWAATDRGFSRFDGVTWSDVSFPKELNLPHDGGQLRGTPSGGLWINRVASEWNRRAWPKAAPLDVDGVEFWTVCRRFEGPPPETRIVDAPREVSSRGDLSVFWDGSATWCEPEEARLSYSHRLDDGGWSAFDPVKGRVFLGLAGGHHRLEVRARDHDFMIDPTPAVLDFVVLPPVWRQGWFLTLLALMGGAVATQSLRIFRERDRLRRANQDLAAEMRNREQAQAAVLERDERYRKLVAAAPDAILTTDLEGRVTLASAKALELLRVPPGRPIEGRSVMDWVAEADREMVKERFEHLASREPIASKELALNREDGTTFDAEISAAPLESVDGEVRGVVLIVRDVSDRHRTAEWLRKLSRAVEQSPSSIVITDPHGNIEYVNKKFTTVTGYSEAEVLGRNPRLLKSGKTSPTQYRELWLTVTSGKEWVGELCNRRKNGELFWELASICPILDPDGRITHFLAIKEDITDRRRLEEEYRQAQKLEAVGRLAGGVAHDFNNILTAILMSLSLAKSDAKLGPDTLEELDEMEREANRAASLTRQLLVFSRRHVLDRKPVNLNELIGNMVKMLRRLLGEDIELVIRGQGVPLWVVADAGMMDQVLMNLCVNARDAMPKGGRIQITSERVEVDAEEARRHPEARPGAFVRLAVADSGCGMDSETREHVFEPFFTTKEVGKGTGLGLATVYSIVGQHQGWIEIDSSLGAGTIFRVYLPAMKSEGPIPAQPSPSKPGGGTETILLVEDDPGLRRLASLTLRRRGYTVLEAPNGPEAVALCQQHRGKVGLLFTDMVMPGGVSGLDLAERLIREEAGIRVLVTSGYSPERAKLDLLSARGIGYLPKPYGDGAMIRAVRAALDQPPPQSAASEAT
ncbi:MAG: PAS domain S-box protein [Verrucomicrobiales bacterium]|nr:PAS domain S-box protein [Verrucomicrobiales bacterium]